VRDNSTSYVVIQLPDGSTELVERSRVARIEFADGNVSTPRASPPAPAAPRADTVHLRAGGRARGTVLEESAAAGVTIRLLDGASRTYRSEEVARVEYADGSVSTLSPAAPRPWTAEGPLDAGFFVGGGRVRGTVLEDNPRSGLRIRLLDGSMQTYPYQEILRVEYADGTVSSRVPPAPPAPPRQAEPKRQDFPFYLALGLGGTFLGGDAQLGVPMSQVVHAQQAHVSGEAGLRLSAAFALGVYADVSAGDPTSTLLATCKAQGSDCFATTGRVGLLFRHAWAPLSSRAPWLSLGTGWEFGGVTVEHSAADDTSTFSDVVSYSGWEYVRLGAGIDFRVSRLLGFGLYGSFAVGEYSQYEDPTTSHSVARSAHTTSQVGLRLILFP
jgi:hypothetical protein